MIIGLPKEVKDHEYRVGLTDDGVMQLVQLGAKVIVEKDAGAGCGITDAMYQAAGAEIIESGKDVWQQANMIIKVKEPMPQEYALIQDNQIIYTYLHLAVFPELTQILCDKNAFSIAYETIEGKKGGLPLLKPMSEVAGRMAVQIGATYLQKEHGGRGVLLSGVPGVSRANVTIIGGGIVGTNACKIAVGMGANVTILDVNVDRLEYLDDIFSNKITTLKSTPANIQKVISYTDLLVGAVLIPGAKAPRLVTKEMLKDMHAGSVIVDVAVDQGGCVETCKPTTHDKPTYVVEDVIHYCVANMPGAVPRSSTFALTNSTLDYAKKIVSMGALEAVKTDPCLAPGVNTYKGKITCKAVAEALDQDYTPLADLI
ncbi:alanine dehydrogenase [bacterium]|nr:alanine dehydrogenase [bacterium]